MGNELSSQRQGPVALRAAPLRLGLFQELIHNYQITLQLEEQVSWSGDTFDIRDINGKKAFQIKGSAMSFTQKKALQYVNGTTIATFRHSFGFFRKYCVYRGNSERDQDILATIEPHTMMGVTVDIKFRNVDGTQQLLVLEGNFRGTETTIVHPQTGSLVGRISKQRLGLEELISGNQTYYVTVAPNVDVALLILIALALDEAKHDKQNR